MYDNLKVKIEYYKDKLQVNFDTLEKFPDLQQYLDVDHEVQVNIVEKKKIDDENERSKNYLNACQPSFAYTKQTYGDAKAYMQFKKEVVNSFSPNPVFHRIIYI